MPERTCAWIWKHSYKPRQHNAAVFDFWQSLQ
jgi:hypothetical protein